MGGSSSSSADELPTPRKSYTPQVIKNHEEIENKFNNILSISKPIFCNVIPVVGQITAVAELPTQFLDYVNIVTSMINLWRESVDQSLDLLNTEIRQLIVTEKIADINSDIKTIKSLLEKIKNSQLKEQSQRVNAKPFYIASMMIQAFFGRWE